MKGKVFFVGAGPGDPELITLKGQNILQKADVVLYDRLVAPALLHLIPSQSISILTGKQRAAHLYSQQEINDLLVKYASSHQVIVRLKGGDLAFFSNLYDELETLFTHKIPFELVPGVTAASGCSAYCGIPLTARNVSDEVHFLSLYNSENFDQKEWKYYAALQGTLVFYMSVEPLKKILQKLIESGMSEKKMAVIEQGTTPYQQITFSTTHRAEQELQQKKFTSPALVIVGEVVSAAEKFGWFRDTLPGNFFSDIAIR
jgi:uroporphyrin-III C-methyltransferase